MISLRKGFKQFFGMFRRLINYVTGNTRLSIQAHSEQLALSNKVTLVGGENIDVSALQLSDDTLPYLMLETAEDGILSIPTSDFPQHQQKTILRLHVFGSGGDLHIRRDANDTFWRFVGKPDVFNTLGLQDGEPYPDSLYYDANQYERSLLWGELKKVDDDKKAVRYEARMGKANLNYPLENDEDYWHRVEIHARAVLDTTGQIVAYWTYELAKHTT